MWHGSPSDCCSSPRAASDKKDRVPDDAASSGPTKCSKIPALNAIVAAHKGAVEVVTAPGEGAAFRVRLPAPALDRHPVAADLPP